MRTTSTITTFPAAKGAKCDNCGERPARRSFADGSGICHHCMEERRRETRGYPPCPLCGHRIWVSNQGCGYYRCDCGLKFNPSNEFDVCHIVADVVRSKEKRATEEDVLEVARRLRAQESGCQPHE